MPSILAQDVVAAVIQDAQQQTTNRTALYDYVDRIHQRVLRESKWRFLLSDPQAFVTLPGVASYNVTSTSAPAGVFQTPLGLTDFNNFAPGTVYSLTNWVKLEEDADSETTLNTLVNRDGSLRQGSPRTYSLSIANPGVITLKQVPDAENTYYPVPETPVTTYTAGGSLAQRTYYGVVTYVDSLGGESTACNVPFTVVIPANSLLTVQSPSATAGSIAGNQAIYGFWNLYLGTSLGNYYLQTPAPVALGTSWTEPTVGAFIGNYPLPSIINTPTASVLSVLSNGMLQATTTTQTNPSYPWALVDPTGGWWEIQVSGGNVTASSMTPTAGVKTFTTLYLHDTTNTYIWGIAVTSSGMIYATQEPTTFSTSTVYTLPPTTTTIQPLNAYVIQFRYYKTRNQIVNPTDVLQIPYAYKDIVIAGVNYLASLYMDERENREPSAKTVVWKNDFEEGLKQIRRDLRVSYRKVDFVRPDAVSQYVVSNNQGIPTMGW